MLTLDEHHVYRWNGQVVPGVNEILQAVGICDFTFVPEQALNKGRTIHKLIENLELGLPISAEMCQYMNYWDQYEKAIKELGVSWRGTEAAFYHNVLGYAGTIDRYNDGYILDIKTGKEYKQYPLQLIAYAGLLVSNGLVRENPQLIGLYLSPEGYKIKEYDYSLGEVWMACLRVYRYAH